MVNDLVDSRRLIWLLILRDISVRYRQSVLGYLWAVIPQIVTVGAFAMLNAWRVMPMGKTGSLMYLCGVGYQRLAAFRRVSLRLHNEPGLIGVSRHQN